MPFQVADVRSEIVSTPAAPAAAVSSFFSFCAAVAGALFVAAVIFLKKPPRALLHMARTATRFTPHKGGGPGGFSFQTASAAVRSIRGGTQPLHTPRPKHTTCPTIDTADPLTPKHAPSHLRPTIAGKSAVHTTSRAAAIASVPRAYSRSPATHTHQCSTVSHDAIRQKHSTSHHRVVHHTTDPKARGLPLQNAQSLNRP